MTEKRQSNHAVNSNDLVGALGNVSHSYLKKYLNLTIRYVRGFEAEYPESGRLVDPHDLYFHLQRAASKKSKEEVSHNSPEILRKIVALLSEDPAAFQQMKERGLEGFVKELKRVYELHQR